MSPRRTEALHEVGHRKHLGTVIFIGLESGDLCGQGTLVVEPGRGFDECGTDRFGACHAGCFKPTKGTNRLVVESNRNRLRHVVNVSRSVIHNKTSVPGSALGRTNPSNRDNPWTDLR